MAKTEGVQRRLPSLDLIKGFEAAARHLSFTRAAEELFLTQSALSRQIQALEEQLGVPLFERRHRALLLTDAGQVLQGTARALLDQFSDTVARIRRDQSAQPLAVTTNQPFAALWLIPRIARFRERHPGVDVFISADNRMVDLERERVDLAVRYCAETMAPPGAVRLFGERLLPVCSPRLAADRSRPLKRPEDLAKHVLLHIDDRFPWLNWLVWLTANGVRDLTPAGSMRFNHFHEVMQAAVDGQGVALGRIPLIDNLLKQRKLVAPFRNKYATTRAYFIIPAPRGTPRPEARAFIDWLMAEAGATVQIDPEASTAQSALATRGRTRRK